ncbi:hypothetical protein HDU93_006526 [Gonapodya sp. JEL0774]|nr:hypothetical protein HDU93_006526 [Gonapodya sp. JEL0774]
MAHGAIGPHGFVFPPPPATYDPNQAWSAAQASMAAESWPVDANGVPMVPGPGPFYPPPWAMPFGLAHHPLPVGMDAGFSSDQLVAAQQHHQQQQQYEFEQFAAHQQLAVAAQQQQEQQQPEQMAQFDSFYPGGSSEFPSPNSTILQAFSITSHDTTGIIQTSGDPTQDTTQDPMDDSENTAIKSADEPSPPEPEVPPTSKDENADSLAVAKPTPTTNPASATTSPPAPVAASVASKGSARPEEISEARVLLEFAEFARATRKDGQSQSSAQDSGESDDDGYSGSGKDAEANVAEDGVGSKKDIDKSTRKKLTKK